MLKTNIYSDSELIHSSGRKAIESDYDIHVSRENSSTISSQNNLEKTVEGLSENDTFKKVIDSQETDSKDLSENHSLIEKVQTKEEIKKRRTKEKRKFSSSLPCSFCREVISFTLMAKHIKQKHPEKEFFCQNCQTSCVDRIGLEFHIQQHSKENLYYLTCELCDRVCTSQYQLQIHKRSHNTKKLSSYDCEFCNKTFLIKAKFEKHLELHKTGKLDRNIKCQYCEKTFKKMCDLKRHLNSHQGSRNYNCGVCGENFVDGTRLKHHKWIHLGHKSFKCHLCDKDFRHKSHLQAHTASFHPEIETTKYVCTHCNRKFAFEYKFKQHLKWHELDQSERVEYESVEYNLVDMNIINQ